jgi:hypothetical protein
MRVLKHFDYKVVAGGGCAEAANEDSGSLFLTKNLEAGAFVGACTGILMAAYTHASPIGYLPWIARMHLTGMTLQALFKFGRLYRERRATGDKSIDPIRDTFCK